jgi:hypothetical protein
LNQYLTELLNAAAIDIGYLTNKYLNSKELAYIDIVLASKQDLEKCFYTSEHGDQLEVLLLFLNAHKNKIIDLMEGKCGMEALKELYTSSVISGVYDCFRFDLSKFPQTYTPTNRVLNLYRIGREDECEGNLGCSWAKEIEGLKTYYRSSGMSEAILEYRPVFFIKIDDSQVLFEGNRMEYEFVLKPNFMPDKLDKFDAELRSQISI